MSTETKFVELRSVFEWTCDECGRDQIEREVPAELALTDLEKQELRDEHGIQPYEQGEWVAAPTNVTCRHCNAEFQTCFPGESEGTEDWA